MNQSSTEDKKNWVGVYDHLPMEDYQKSPGLSRSMLLKFAQTPKHLQHYLKGEEDGTDTLNRRIYSAVHYRVLECVSDSDLEKGVLFYKTRLSKSITEQAVAENKIPILDTKKDQILGISNAILTNPDCTQFLTGGTAEQSIYVKHPDLNFIQKIRTDYIIPEKGVIVDVKNFATTDETEVMKHFHKMKYHWQSAYYLDVAKAAFGGEWTHFVHLVVTDKEPYMSDVFVYDDAALEKARLDYFHLLPLYEQCLLEDKWPGRDSGIKSIGLPSYAYNTGV